MNVEKSTTAWSHPSFHHPLPLRRESHGRKRKKRMGIYGEESRFFSAWKLGKTHTRGGGRCVLNSTPRLRGRAYSAVSTLSNERTSEDERISEDASKSESEWVSPPPPPSLLSCRRRKGGGNFYDTMQILPKARENGEKKNKGGKYLFAKSAIKGRARARRKKWKQERQSSIL